MLRYDSPVQLTTRAANTDLDLSRTRIKQGDFVYLFIGAANRDLAQFDHPDRFDVSRPDSTAKTAKTRINFLSISPGVHSQAT
jgi:cytochrome P450